nr:hypothetical protein [Tanacetum cinerariifolium]
MVESDTPKKKKLQEQIDAQVARELEEQQEKENMRMNEQIARDAVVARIHAEEELQGMIDSLDKSNETIAKYLQEYQDFASELPLEKRIELINDLVKYQDNYSKVYKFQSQQKRPMTKKQTREYYMAVIRSNLGWKVKDFKEQEHVKKQKSSDEAPEMEEPTEEITEEKMKELMMKVGTLETSGLHPHVKHQHHGSLIDSEEFETYHTLYADPLRGTGGEVLEVLGWSPSLLSSHAIENKKVKVYSKSVLVLLIQSSLLALIPLQSGVNSSRVNNVLNNEQ